MFSGAKPEQSHPLLPSGLRTGPTVTSEAWLAPEARRVLDVTIGSKSYTKPLRATLTARGVIVHRTTLEGMLTSAVEGMLGVVWYAPAALVPMLIGIKTILPFAMRGYDENLAQVTVDVVSGALARMASGHASPPNFVRMKNGVPRTLTLICIELVTNGALTVNSSSLAPLSLLSAVVAVIDVKTVLVLVGAFPPL